MNAKANDELADLSNPTTIKEGQQFACFFLGTFLPGHVYPRPTDVASMQRRDGPKCFDYDRC